MLCCYVVRNKSFKKVLFFPTGLQCISIVSRFIQCSRTMFLCRVQEFWKRAVHMAKKKIKIVHNIHCNFKFLKKKKRISNRICHYVFFDSGKKLAKCVIFIC